MVNVLVSGGLTRYWGEHSEILYLVADPYRQTNRTELGSVFRIPIYRRTEKPLVRYKVAEDLLLSEKRTLTTHPHCS